MLLGILDRSTLTLGDNRKVDFSKTIIIMTSNLGAREMTELVTGKVGFAPASGAEMEEDSLDYKIYQVAKAAARRQFSPEFINRIDKIVVFRALKHEQLRLILDLELRGVQNRIDQSKAVHFNFVVSEEAKEFMLSEGVDHRYGARHLKRAIERLLVAPLANLSATRQAQEGDKVLVELHQLSRKLIFLRDTGAETPLAIGAFTSSVLPPMEGENRAAA